MGSDHGSGVESVGWSAVRRAVAVVLVCSLAVSAGAVAASADGAARQEGEPNGTDAGAPATETPGGGPAAPGDGYAVKQDGRCFQVSALSGNESVREFYGYGVPFADNPYRAANSTSYSSEGTTALQRPDASLVFLYEGPDGNLSLVFVHGKYGGGADGGSVTANLSGLPADGRWAVKDDLYDGPNNYDRWNASGSNATVDWTYGPNRTDGGAYEGLGRDFEVSVDQAFDEDAALYRRYYDGNVSNWSFVAGSREDPRYRSLNTSEPVTVASGGCGPLNRTPGADETPTDPGADGDDGDGDDDGVSVGVGGEDGARVNASEDGATVTVG